jgi:Na+/proline symporter
MAFWSFVCSLAFLSALTVVGAWHSRRVKTGEDFALAGRKLPAGVVFGTLVATWIGTGSLFGNAEFTYRHGLAALLLPVTAAGGILVLAQLAGRARELPADSVPQILRLRFGRGAQLIGAVALIGAYLIIVSRQFRAGAGILEHIFPYSGMALRDRAADIFPSLADTSLDVWNSVPGVIGFALFVILYTMLAGMVSVAWTDVANGLLMAVGIGIALVVLIGDFRAADPNTVPRVIELQSPVEPVSPIQWLGFLLPPFLLVMGDANLYQRFMSADSPRSARRAAVWMFFGVLVMEWSIIGLAFLGRQLLPEEPQSHGHVIISVAYNLLPAWLAVMLIMSAVAVIVTTADSFLLGTATSVSADLWGKLGSAGVQRVIVLVLGLLSIGLAFASENFFSVAMYAYTLYGATLTPAVVCALVWPDVPRGAIVGGMLAGLATALVWKLALVLERMPAALTPVEPVLPALGVHLLALIGLAIAFRRPT